MASTLRQRRPEENPQRKSSGTTANEVLTGAPPPWHAVFLLVVMLMLFILLLPSTEALDEIARVETFTKTLFDFTTKQVATIRALFASVIWISTITYVCYGTVEFTPPYLKDSKLKRVPIKLKGFRRMIPFTNWCVSSTSAVLLTRTVVAPKIPVV